MESAVLLLLFGLCGFFMLKAFVASLRMSQSKANIEKDMIKKKRYHYFLEMHWPFSLALSKNENVKEHRQHFVDFWFYIALIALTMAAFGVAVSLFQ